MSDKKNVYYINHRNHYIQLYLSKDIYFNIINLTAPYFITNEIPINYDKNKLWRISCCNQSFNEYKDYERIEIDSDFEGKMYYLFSKERRSVVVCEEQFDKEWITQSVLRLIRIIFKLLVYEEGEIFAHGGLVSIRDYGIAILGEKKSGKTTTIMSCLKKGAVYITNDDVSLNIENNRIMSYGWPRGIAVRCDSLKQFFEAQVVDELYEKLNHPGNQIIKNSTLNGSEPNGLIFFRPKELTALYKCELKTKSILSAIVFTEFSSDRNQECLIKKLSSNEGFMLLSNHLMTNPGKYNEFLLNSFCLPNPMQSLIKHKRIFAKIPMFKLRQGFNKTEDTFNALTSIIASWELS